MHNLSVKILIIIMAYFSSISMTYSDDKTMQKISNFLIDKTEVTIGEFKVYAKETNFISMAEKNGGGLVYENGWVQKKDGTGKGHMVWQLWTMSQLFISILMKQKIIVNGIKKEFLQT